ncbi:methyltransferase [candidate division WOR-1 bacterium RIFCSPHIGHO2_01_FULL_53_15]|uniref:Methyltransferase n=1 Tax=candidate division WOR-1 bacterium RIFCSPHIGHO2_01_FULL_53_15 TaxID=1802564 RepID=A0A1F4Q2W1_UNCSA|nr:MAG: methyltransferase [candidate division WOR-1 bacterium RIFCSPHIGHO2_01_FULL_53_15]
MICRVCDSSDLKIVVDLGDQPWANNFLTKEELGRENYYPLRVMYCQNCATAQLGYTVPKETMFSDHTYLSGITRSLCEHFKNVADEVDSRYFAGVKNKSVLDIGSNDGTQLKHFKGLGYEVLGVESSKTIAKIANEAGIPTLNKFFNLDAAREIGRKFEVINAAGVFFHLEELHSVTDGIRECLAPDGAFVVQFLYMKRIIENLAFDQIYHEHLLYYNLRTIEVLLNRHGLSMFDAYLAPIHGGSIIGFVAHRGKKQPLARLLEMRQAEESGKSNQYETYLAFAKRIEAMKQENLAYLAEKKRLGKKIYGFGAPVKGNTLLNYFGIGTQYLDCLVEKNELRRGLYSPGMHIPVVIEKELSQLPDIYYVLAWNFKNEILANNRRLLDEGVEFYFPVNPKE